MRVAISRDAVEEMINDIRDCISVDGYWAILERLKKIPPVDWSVQEFADRCRECGAKYGKLLKQKWIPVSERLPEEDGQYLITVKYVHVDGYDDIYAEHGEWTDGRWDMFCFGHCGEVEDIIAWMPLPTPYEPQESDTEKLKPCINYEDGCEEWAGCPCVHYKAEMESEE